MQTKKNLISLARVFLAIFIALLIFTAGFLAYLMIGKAEPAEEIIFGVTFSQPFAIKMGLNWQKTYLAILDDLKVRNLRLVAYWPEIEKQDGEYSFNDLDWQINEAEKRNAKVILAIGRKLPRWPECHIPGWAGKLSEEEQQEKVLLLIIEIIEHYKKSQNIKAWQIENEPFFESFGECPALDKNFLDQEIALARNLDNRPIVITASGELSPWINEAKRADILGTTLYRVVWNKYLGNFRYPFPPVFYQKRADLIKKFFGLQEIIMVELAVEPWGRTLLYELPLEEQFQSMNLEEFKKTIQYGKETGFKEVYLWGAEWWYWLKTAQGDNAIWDEAKKLWAE
ncbi:MAG: hypothetical protein A3A94_00485 [Candidatus Portnoybacteria bacterium RIFCSPLOWO2_01_FULL_43_11]|uniref:Uncharacterized protein n=4 Tax=Candidatus Portnoyibacteriota TaxID=1817913 RepID=A0A1G2FCU5_9BACT|nr:MAG: hypothetical protein A2815_01710 [Candidatus Portnoybacteria bacterium RIFCSPHIGHO2_01_FULL_40_12b]OGZ39042.1 MAG: hypothetical protein A3E90_01350 [Candidatus Portnoybacteria bacterium RIFCSPHIGHO2_12_FULL_40_11]OGZ39215.1 MAG: hypothetical protein A3A94_00485 [Candidatus Portnoybacteria bacterium RIFCSPLOWO2_01_FULL_43_11]OGZ39752.1 MAG: hypothetical protein A3I20_03090 [Candidatus Portnoybacteria bacterium RIFCSPLOWO2_02_FULL_40_15]